MFLLELMWKLFCWILFLFLMVCGAAAVLVTGIIIWECFKIPKKLYDVLVKRPLERDQELREGRGFYWEALDAASKEMWKREQERNFGKNNKIFTKEEADRARERLRAKGYIPWPKEPKEEGDNDAVQ